MPQDNTPPRGKQDNQEKAVNSSIEELELQSATGRSSATRAAERPGEAHSEPIQIERETVNPNLNFGSDLHVEAEDSGTAARTAAEEAPTRFDRPAEPAPEGVPQPPAQDAEAGPAGLTETVAGLDGSRPLSTQAAAQGEAPVAPDGRAPAQQTTPQDEAEPAPQVAAAAAPGIPEAEAASSASAPAASGQGDPARSEPTEDDAGTGGPETDVPTALAVGLDNTLIAENSADGTLVGTVSIHGAGGGGPYSYQIVDDAGGRFAVDGTGRVVVADGSLLDHEAADSHQIVVRVTDASGGSTTETYSIDIGDVNEAPTDMALDLDTVSEAASDGDLVGTITTVDPENPAETFTHSLLDDAGGRFAIDNDGRITVADSSLLDRETSGSHDLVVRVTDSGGLSYTETFTITVGDADEFDVGAVADIDGAIGGSIAEDASDGDQVGITASASDADATDGVTYSLTDTAGGRFQIDANSGIITVADSSLLDRETDASHTVTVRATSDDGSTSTETFTITVGDADEFDVGAVTDNDGATGGSIAEDASNGDQVGITALATDADATDTVTYSLTNTAGGRFTIDANSGIITVADSSLLDRETDASHTVTVRATSDDGSTSTETFTITVGDADEFDVGAVTDSDGATGGSIAEDASNGDQVGITALASDADATDNVTYSLTDNAGGRFQIDANSGIITVADSSLLDREANANHAVTVRATSDDGSTSTETFTITVGDADEFDVGAVTDNDGATGGSIAENASNGDQVGITALATDADATDDVTYSLTDTAGGRFTIDANTGVITVADSSLLDFETDTSHTVTVRATSDDGSTSTETFTIAVEDVSEGGVGNVTDNDGATGGSIAEDASNGDQVGITALATDPDASDDVTYSLTDTAGGRFTIDANSGVITVADSSLLDRETNASHTVTVRATSDDGSTSTETFTITVGDVDEFDVGAVTDNDGATGGSIAENASNGDQVGITALATDADATDDVTYSLTDTAGGRFTIDANSGVITVADSSLLDFETDTSHTVTVRATSDDGSTSTETFTITVGDVSEGGVGSVTDNDGATGGSIAEDASNGDQVGITALATDPDASDDVTYSLTDTAGGRFTIDANSGVITVADSSLLDRETNASHTVTVRATSDDGSTSTETFTITVGDADEFDVGAVTDNDGATGGSIAENASNGDQVGITALATDADATDDVTYSLTDTAGGGFTIDANNGIITVADSSLLDREANAIHTVTVRATSDDGSTSTETFTITVGDADEFDVGAVTDNDGATGGNIAEDASNSDQVGITALATDADATDGVTYSLTDNAGGRFQIDASSGVITVADSSLLDFETDTSHTVTVRATSDDGSTSTETFTVTVEDVSEGGVGSITDNDGATGGSIAENASNGDQVGITALATDPDASDDVTYSLTDNASGRFTIDANSGVITVADSSLLDREADASHTVTVRATSDDGSTSTETFTIAVGDADEFDVGAITDNDGATGGSIAEDASNGDQVGITALATDADATDDVTYSLTDNAGGRFTIDANSGIITVADSSLLDREANASHTVTVRASSDDGSTSTETFTITVGDADEFDVGAITDNDGATGGNIAEDASNGDQVGITALATDADATDDVTYSLTDNAGGRFQIDANSGIITVADSSLLDREADASHTVTVRATSDDGSTSTETFTITVGDADEFDVGAVTDNDGATGGSIAENASNGDQVGITALATDPDATDDVTYSLTDNAGGRFTIDANSGIITVADSSLLDRETNASHTVTVRATSDDGSTSTETFTIAVGDADEFDIGAVTDNDGATGGSIAEDASNGDQVGITALATDADATDDVTYSLTDNAGGRFTIDANNGIITVADSSLLDREANASHTVTVRATSDDGSTSTETFTITVGDADEFDVGAVTDNDGATGGNIAEDASNGDQVGITALASDADATDDVTYSLTDNAGGRFTIDANSGIITVADSSLLDREANASHTVTVRATSDDGSTSTETFTITVGDADEFDVGAVTDNDGATGGSIAENASNGDQVGITALATDADATDDVTYSLTDNAGGRFTIDANSGVITVADSSLLDREADASHTVTVRATSDDGSTSTETFTITVGDADEFDVGAITDNDGATGGSIAEDASNGDQVGITALASDADATDDVTYSLTDNAGGRFTIDANSGIITVADNSLLDREANASHTVTVRATSDDGSTSTETFTIAVGDADEFDVGAVTDNDGATGGSIAENASNGDQVGITALATDADATDNVTYSLTDDAGGRFTIDANNGIITVADSSLLDYETATSHNVTVQATSSDGSTSTQTFTVNITDVDDTAETPNLTASFGTPSHQASTTTQVFSDNFNDGNFNGWSVQDLSGGSASNNWYVSGGQLIEQSNSGQSRMTRDMSGDVSTDSYDISVDISVDTGSSGWNDFVGMTFGYQDANNYYEVVWTAPSSSHSSSSGYRDFILNKVSGGVTTELQKIDNINLGSNFTLKVAVTDSGISVSTDGVERLTAAGEQPAIGTVGLVSTDNDSGVAYDNVVVNELTDEGYNVPFNIGASLVDTDGSESLSAITVSGVPSGVVLSAGTDNGDGTWTLSSGDLAGLTAFFPSNTDGSNIAVSVTSTESSNGATATATVDLGIIVGSTGDDSITGSADGDTIYGFEGADTLNGGGGDDVIFGGAGSTPATPTFAQQTGGSNPFNGIDIGSEATPTFVDIDNDGDLDMFVGEASGTLNYYQNTGTASSPTYTLGTNPFGSTDVGSDSNPTFVDIDGDGDMDAFVGEDNGVMNYFQNTGTASNPIFGSPVTGAFGLPDVGSDSTPTFVDIDNDGDMDLFVGESDGNINYYENTGTSSSASFASGVSNAFDLADRNNDSEVTFADLDGDGDLDAVFGDDDGRLYYQENTGSASSPSFAAAVANPFGLADIGHESSPTFADIDGDGDLDLIVGEGNSDGGDDDDDSGDGRINYFENTTVQTGNTLNGGAGNDTLVSGAAADVIDGGADTDTVDYSASNAGVNVNLDDGIGTGGHAAGDSYTSIEGVIGSAYDDTVYGIDTGGVTANLGAGNDTFDNDMGDATQTDTIDGGAGNDTIWTGYGNDSLGGGSGDDSLYGEGGDDTLSGGAGSDMLYGSSGTDTAAYTDSDAGVTVNLGTGSASGGHATGDTLSSIENLIGSGFGDTLTGDSGANVLSGMGGADFLYGGAGNDTLDGGDGVDSLYGGDGSDLFMVLQGSEDAVFGGTGASWTDTIHVDGAGGGSPGNYGSDWTVSLDAGTIDASGANYIDLSDDAAGTITLQDGSEVTFEGVERIEW